MLEEELNGLKFLLGKESQSEQMYLIMLYRRLLSLHPNIRRWVEKSISDGELHMEMPNLENGALKLFQEGPERE